MSGDLLVVIPEGQNIVQVFQDGGCDPLIDKLEAELKSYNIDVTTEAGRKQIASIARKIASTKIALDDAGKALIADKQAQVALVNKERARIKERMQRMQDDFRRPLTEFEAEAKRQLEALEQKKREETAAREAEIRKEQERQFAEAAAKAEKEAFQRETLAQVDVTSERIESLEEPTGMSFSELKESYVQHVLAKSNSGPEREKCDLLICLIAGYLTCLSSEDLEYLFEKIKRKWPRADISNFTSEEEA